MLNEFHSVKRCLERLVIDDLYRKEVESKGISALDDSILLSDRSNTKNIKLPTKQQMQTVLAQWDAIRASGVEGDNDSDTDGGLFLFRLFHHKTKSNHIH